MNTTIRFLRMYQGRPVGALDSAMGFGVHDALVRRGIAEFVEEELVSAAVSEPQLSSESKGERKSRRRYEREE